jgi:ribosomal protein L20A (L18A)
MRHGLEKIEEIEEIEGEVVRDQNVGNLPEHFD